MLKILHRIHQSGRIPYWAIFPSTSADFGAKNLSSSNKFCQKSKDEFFSEEEMNVDALERSQYAGDHEDIYPPIVPHSGQSNTMQGIRHEKIVR